MGKNAQRRREQRGHNYQAALLGKLASGEMYVRPGTVTKVDVLHDGWCGIWQGQRCNCNPDFRQTLLAGLELN